MMNSTEAILNALECAHGVVIIRYPDLNARSWLIDEVESLCDSPPFKTSSVEAALSRPGQIVLLAPESEEEAVIVLDRTSPRTQPIILFLSREMTLSNAPNLRGLTKGKDLDPEEMAEVDLDEEITKFQKETGMMPEDWLTLWRSDSLPHTAANFTLYYQATLFV